MILFEHIPKTGGSTLNHILQRKYPNSFKIHSNHPLESIWEYNQLSRADKNKIKLVRGHGASLIQNQTHSTYSFTMLRNPVSRIISQYVYLQSRFDHHSASKARKLSLLEYPDYAAENGEDNLQTRFLSSLISDTLQFKKTEVTELHLHESKQKLDTFSQVYFTEHFNEALLQIRSDLKWKLTPWYTKQNKSSVKKQEVSDKVVEKIESIEKHDLALYNYAYKHFRTEVNKSQLKQFEKQNKIYQSMAHLYHVLKRLR